MDRAMQLEAYLRSMKKHFKDYYRCKHVILYKCSNDEYRKGYDIVMKEYSEFEYIEEKEIKNDMLSLLDKYGNHQYLVMFSDDNIWKDDFHTNHFHFKEFETNEKAVCYSLRLHPEIKKCYPMGNIDTPPPVFEKEYVWKWNGLLGDWGYPCSIDGHIFRMNFASTLLKALPYKNVNQIEAFMSAQHKIIKDHFPYMVCGERSAIFNIPLNRVQTNSPNIHMDVDQKMLNENFLNGEKINIDNFKGFKPVSPHQEVKVEFEK
jgi:hypothetical protein